jgi:hypothetical protein
MMSYENYFINEQLVKIGILGSSQTFFRAFQRSAIFCASFLFYPTISNIQKY